MLAPFALAALFPLAAQPSPPAALPSPPAAQARFDFEARAETWLATLELDSGDTGHEAWNAVLESEFLTAQLGGFDIRLHRAELDEREYAKDFQEVLRQALSMQLAWNRWMGNVDGTVEDDAERVEKWIGRMGPKALSRAARSSSGDFFSGAGTNQEVAAALERLATAMAPGAAPAASEDPAGAEIRPTPVVIAASRRLFVDLTAASGYLFPLHRPRIWQERNLFAPNNWGNGYQIVGLRGARHPFTVETVDEDWEIKNYLTSSMELHLADRLSASLLHGYFAFSTDPLLETALATELTIAATGSIRIVNDFSTFSWSRAGASTQPYQRFVPGGNPAGGTLPARKAQAGPIQRSANRNMHSKELGNDFYIADLQDRRKRGLKISKRDYGVDKSLRDNKHVHFLLESGQEEHVVRAPLLGDGAEKQALPPLRYLDDYEDFHTAYRALFVHWLTTEADEDRRAAVPALFARVAQRKPQETLSKIAEEVFGEPLDWSAGTTSLEGEYLVWLASRR